MSGIDNGDQKTQIRRKKARNLLSIKAFISVTFSHECYNLCLFLTEMASERENWQLTAKIWTERNGCLTCLEVPFIGVA